MNPNASRAPAPACFSLGDRKASSSSADSDSSSSSSSSSSAEQLFRRGAATKRSSAGSPEGKKPHSPTANVYTYCGRHTDQYLLGGWTDVLTGIFKRD